MQPALEQQLISLRREFHKYPEPGWCEFRTTARIIEELTDTGIPVRWGKNLHNTDNMPGMPDTHVLEEAWQRAVEQTGRQDLLLPMKGGYTGCIAEIQGAFPGKATVFRVDIDACELEETCDPSHIPARLGFASTHQRSMHACGHDAHTAIGIGAAKLLWQHKDKLHGRVYILFQPAEEGLRGAASMCGADLLQDCDNLIGLHVGLHDLSVGTVAASCTGFLSSTKLDALFHGKAAHAGLCPELGKNALAAGAKAVLDLLALPEKYDGLCRINVGKFHGGSGRNVIPAEARLTLETRSDKAEQNVLLGADVRSICAAAAAAYGCTVEILPMGGANGAECDASLAAAVADILSDMPQITHVLSSVPFGGSEDITTLMRTVQRHGGKATELIIGMPLTAPHHSANFDIDEKVIPLGAEILAEIAMAPGYCKPDHAQSHKGDPSHA